MESAFWDRMSQRYDDEIRLHDDMYIKTMERTRTLLAGSDVVLDFACATGEMSLDMAAHVRELHGIDSSVRMIELAQQKASDRQVDNVQFHAVDVFHPLLAPGYFSAVVAFNIFHLVDDAPRVLARLHEILSAGGLLISQTPCLGERSWLLRFLFSLAQRFRLAPPIRSFKVMELEALVSDGDFDLIESLVWDETNAVHWIVGRKF